MPVKIFSCVTQGLEGKLVEVEADILSGLSAFSIVGLGDTAVQEAKERIRSAIKNSEFVYPQQKKVINLAPAHLKKHGPHFDLPMAISLIAASGQVKADAFKDTLIVGELALDGTVRPVNGVLTITLFAKKHLWKKIIIPEGNYDEAQLVKDIEIIPLTHLANLVSILESARRNDQVSKNKNSTQATSQKPKEIFHTQKALSQKGETNKGNAQDAEKLFAGNIIDFADIKGHPIAKKALQIAAAGGHHVLLTGPPGVGKTMLAKALPSILPPLSEEELFEVMQIYSCAGLFSPQKFLNTVRPFRQVHSTCSLTALTGGGIQRAPGEISLAHNGVLFLDEVAEFPRTHLESLRQPLEQKEMYVSRSSGTVKYPANFTFIASMNPCPCGYFGDEKKECECRPYQIFQYRKKLSGPLLDRIDLTIQLSRQSARKYQEKEVISSLEIRQKIIIARHIQEDRFQNRCIKINATMSPAEIKKYCALNKQSCELLLDMSEKHHFSDRVYHQVMKTARTIADLHQKCEIGLEELSEALLFRQQF